jgi:copper transporter 1
MDMSDSSSMAPMGTFHWSTTGDALWFSSWVPSSEGAYIGSCIALFILAVLARASTALQHYVDAWMIMKEEKRLHAKSSKGQDDKSSVMINTSMNEAMDGLRRRDGEANGNEKIPEYDSYPSPSLTVKAIPPARLELPHVPDFHWYTDTLRSLLSTLVTFISYLLMLVVMTGNGAYFIVIIAGVFVGEMVFGRYRSLRGFHEDHNH